MSSTTTILFTVVVVVLLGSQVRSEPNKRNNPVVEMFLRMESKMDLLTKTLQQVTRKQDAQTELIDRIQSGVEQNGEKVEENSKKLEENSKNTANVEKDTGGRYDQVNTKLTKMMKVLGIGSEVHLPTWTYMQRGWPAHYSDFSPHEVLPFTECMQRCEDLHAVDSHYNAMVWEKYDSWCHCFKNASGHDSEYATYVHFEINDPTNF